MANKLRVLFAGGGTGGHIYPMIAVAQVLKDKTIQAGMEPDFRYFGNPLEYSEELKLQGLRISRIASSKWRRYFSLLNFLDFFKFWFSLFQCLWKMYWFMPDVIFSKGGPGALPIVIVGFFYAIPVVIHDSDTIPGLTNRLSARLARFIELAFASAAGRLPKVRAQINIVGNPVRKFLLDKVPAISAKSDLKFDPAKPLMLVFGGSQGSNRMNDFIIANLETILLKFQIMHVVGKEKFADYKNQFDFLTKNYSPILMTNYHYAEYLGNQEMNVAMDAADLIVARGGSGSIFEIAAKGKPSIIVPFPESAADHQKENAYDYAASGAAEVIEQENLLPSIFMSEAEKLVFQPEANAKMVAAANAFARPDSAEKIAVDILTLIS
mgnify:CR=1 FL=1